MDTIKWIQTQHKRKLNPPLFRFNLSDEAASHNFEVLKKNNFSLERVLASSDFLPCHFGSEFKETKTLERLFAFHPYWPRMRKILEEGTSYKYNKETYPKTFENWT